jgi:hypothetical protein
MPRRLGGDVHRLIIKLIEFDKTVARSNAAVFVIARG